ncbi:hypothetical protein [Roseomonas xinghualingensis]|uniref:hypothetical protein n=1 Tax=Roseomonas xinghualingensis TaxID=2986475 RepID=UPI0021F18260|nr:hypothetical protein [Roseomonas sp. SXEYE001]MCV4209988.1 hypothetical protein [Roseomonas sp. SXEYE001]
MIDLKTEGAGEFLRLRIEAAQMDEGIRAEIRRTAREGRAALIAALSQAGTGRSYKASGERRTRIFSKARRLPAYTSSAPGRPPAKASGNLLASIRTKYPRADKGYGAKIFAHRGNAFYRHFLEFGAGPAKRGKRIGAGGRRAPRPVFTPLQRQFEGKLAEAVQRAVDKFARP